ncbi:MAG: hypothetical protein WDZ48_09270 [Pirellulales bacterium]
MARLRQLILDTPLSTALSWFLILGMVWVVPAAIWKGDYPLALMATVAVFVSLLPAILRQNYRVALPWELECLILLQLYLHTFWGVWLRLYDSVWFWDKLLHLKGTLLVSFVGFLIAYALHASGRLRLSGPFLGLFTVVFGNALGVWWEIIEFTVDKTLSKNTQYGLDNTMWDLIYNLAGSLLAAGLGWLYVRYANPEERRRLAQPLADLAGPWLRASRIRKKKRRMKAVK